ncbi:hypothetical protein GVX82_04415 [Patescibacteria group bacterium]|jgi:hypothetical protein|nr:hypothetical protein [Patescibacteria group bacterium]
MSTDIQVTIGILELLAIIVSLGGTLITLAWFSSARLTRVETLLEGVDRRLTTLEGKSSGAFMELSPLSLTRKGRELLEGSGLRAFVDEGCDELMRVADYETEAPETDYDLQELAFELFESLSFDPEFERSLKQYAFEQGISMQVLRRIAGIYFRDVLRDKKGSTHAGDRE